MATLGVTSIGASSDDTSDSWMYRCNLPAMPEAGTLQSVHIALRSLSASCEGYFALYGPTDNLLATSSLLSIGTVDPAAYVVWSGLSTSLSNGVVYYLAFHVQNATTYYFDTSATGYSVDIDVPTFGTPNDPFVDLVNNADTRLSAYITYTTGGGGGTKLLLQMAQY